MHFRLFFFCDMKFLGIGCNWRWIGGFSQFLLIVVVIEQSRETFSSWL